MENKNILMLRYHPMSVKFTNSFYTGQTENDLSEYTIIDVTSRVKRDRQFMSDHPNFANELSPFYIGPVVASDGTKANIFEVFWQCGKVYPCHDDGGRPNAAFFEWRNNLYAGTKFSKDMLRHPCKSLGYEHKDCLYFAWFDKNAGEYVPLGIVESRKKVYFPEYAKLVSNTESFRWLKSLVDAGTKIALVDFDGYNYNEECGMRGKYTEYENKCKKNKIAPELTESEFLSVRSMKDVTNCPFLRAGHGFVIKALLQRDIAVENGEVVDYAGILE